MRPFGVRHFQNRQIEGRNPVLEALRSKTKVVKIFLEEKIRADERIREIRDLAQKEKIPIEYTRRKRLEKISRTTVHQGVIAWAEFTQEPSIRSLLQKTKQENRDSFLVIIPEITYEHNLGAVLRTAEGAGVDAVIVSNRAPLLTPLVSRMAMGATEYIPLIHENIFSVLQLLRKEGIKTVAADARAEKPLFKAPLSGPIALIIGNESKGLSETINKRIDLKVKIPMFGEISSLNLSVAAAVIMYEIVRQRRFLM